MKNQKRYKIEHCGYTTRCEYASYPNYKGEYVIFKNLEGGKDFRLNKYFYRMCVVEGDVVKIIEN